MGSNWAANKKQCARAWLDSGRPLTAPRLSTSPVEQSRPLTQSFRTSLARPTLRSECCAQRAPAPPPPTSTYLSRGSAASKLNLTEDVALLLRNQPRFKLTTGRHSWQGMGRISHPQRDGREAERTSPPKTGEQLGTAASLCPSFSKCCVVAQCRMVKNSTKS